MCGRYVSASPPDELARYFDAHVEETAAEAPLEESYNVAPGRDVYVVVKTGGVRRVDEFHWGLVPFWAKDAKTGLKMINARAEGLADKNAYKRAFKKRRCIIPADGFYEWKKVPGQKRKQPYYIERNDGEPLAFAGLWEVWRGPDGQEDDTDPLRSCTIITTTPNDTMAEIHDRMPVILPPGAWEAWLDPDNDDLETLGKLLIPAPNSLLTIRPVSLMVNNARENGPELLDPFEPDTTTLDTGG
jgi:putative SOS response-associated peptidase YedK